MALPHPALPGNRCGPGIYHHRFAPALTHMRLTIWFIILPGASLFFIPGAILWFSVGEPASWALAGPAEPWFWIAILFAAPGILLAGWTTRLFVDRGEGTPAPWDPPRKLVVAGPYRHVRNPMISGVLLVLIAETLFFGSWPLFGWVVAFFLLNTVYFSRVEEPGLDRRFGEDYRHYRANVPRWIPRWRPWNDS